MRAAGMHGYGNSPCAHHVPALAIVGIGIEEIVRNVFKGRL